MKDFVKYAVMFVLLVAAQVVVFNRICLFGVAIPLVFIYFVIKLPVTLAVNWSMVAAFTLGLAIDIFSDTPGMNSLALTTLAALRLPMLHLYLPRQEDLANPEPSMRTLGPGVFSKYAVTLTLLYSLMFFTIEAFTFFHPLMLLLKAFATTLLTSLIILALDSLTVR